MNRTFAILLLSGVLIAGCKELSHPKSIEPTQQKASVMTKEVTIKLGELGPELLKRYPDLVKVQHQPAGVDFYAIDWDKRPRGVVTFAHGKNQFTINNVVGISAGQDLGELTHEGLSEYTILAGITDPDLISHDEARLKTYVLPKNIEQAGWKIITSRSRPRLTGNDRLNYAPNTSTSIGQDIEYVPTLQEWMRIEDLTAWEFYADHQYLKVYFKRERTLLDPAKPGSYLLTYTIKSEAEHFRAYVGPEGRASWKELLAGELATRPDKRAKAEATLKAQGLPIDETYQDPPLPKLK
jgi:hypothetical protein